VTALDTLLVFTADGCPHCRAATDDLRARRVSFREVNLSLEADGLERLRSVCWEHRLPVFVDHERVSVGFRGGSSSLAELGLE
jgi:glutaredoxin